MVVDDAIIALSALGMPEKQQADICAQTLLSMAGDSKGWFETSNEYIEGLCIQQQANITLYLSETEYLTWTQAGGLL